MSIKKTADALKRLAHEKAHLRADIRAILAALGDEEGYDLGLGDNLLDVDLDEFLRGTVWDEELTREEELNGYRDRARGGVNQLLSVLNSKMRNQKVWREESDDNGWKYMLEDRDIREMKGWARELGITLPIGLYMRFVWGRKGRYVMESKIITTGRPIELGRAKGQYEIEQKMKKTLEQMRLPLEH